MLRRALILLCVMLPVAAVAQLPDFTELVEKQGVQLRKLPDEVLQRFYEIAQQVYAEQAAKDPQFKKVYDSYSAFMKDSAAYQKISEQTYYEVREQQNRK